MVNVEAVVRLPVSKTFTQNVPAFCVTVICAVELAIAFGVELVSVHAVEPLGVPRPRPTPLVEEELKLASVTLTAPACVTVNVNTFEPCTASVPENVSVGGAVGVGDVELSGSPQPAARIASRQPMTRGIPLIYSALSTIAGSTRAARRAGSHTPTNATALNE
jgi:hypothetical protein